MRFIATAKGFIHTGSRHGGPCYKMTLKNDQITTFTWIYEKMRNYPQWKKIANLLLEGNDVELKGLRMQLLKGTKMVNADSPVKLCGIIKPTQSTKPIEPIDPIYELEQQKLETILSKTDPALLQEYITASAPVSLGESSLLSPLLYKVSFLFIRYTTF